MKDSHLYFFLSLDSWVDFLLDVLENMWIGKFYLWFTD